MPTPVILEIRANTRNASEQVQALSGEVRKALTGIREQFTDTSRLIDKTTFSPEGIKLGVKAALGSLKTLDTGIGETHKNLLGLGTLRMDGKAMTAGLAEAKSDLASLSEVATGTRSRLEGLGKTRLNFQEMLKGAGGANTELDEVSRRLRTTRREMDSLGAARIANAGLFQRGAMLSNVGFGLRSAGQAMTQGYSEPVTQAVGYAVQKSIDYEADFANVKKTVGGSDTELKKLLADLEDLSTKVPESFKAITDIASTVGQLGVARDQVVNVTKDIIQLHVATKLTTETGTLAFVKFANSIGEPAQNIGRLGSVISELDKDSKATSNEVLSMAQRIAGTGHAAGLSGPQILAFANAFAGVGVRAQQGGSAISRSIAQIDKAVNDGGKNLDSFAAVAGMSSEKFKKEFKENAAGALAAFVEGLGTLRDRGEDLFPIMDTLGLKSQLQKDALLRASGAGHDLTNALSRVDKAYQDNTATGERYTKATDNTAAKLKELHNQADKVAAKFGDTLIPILMKLEPDAERLLGIISHLADEFDKLPEPVKQGALELLAVSVAAGPLLSLLGSVVGVVGSLYRGVAAFKTLRMAAEVKGIATELLGLKTGAVEADGAVGGLLTRLKLLRGAGAGTAEGAGGAVAAGGLLRLFGGGSAGGLLGGAGMAGILGRLGLMSGGLGYGGVTGLGSLGGNLLGGGLLAAPAMVAGFGAYKIMGQQNAGYDAEQRGDGVADLSPYIDRIAELRKQLRGLSAGTAQFTEVSRNLRAEQEALRTLSGSNSRARQADAGNGLTEAMAKHIGEATGVQCGQAITNALRANGVTASVSNLAQAAAANKSLQIRPDAAGHLPPGTIVFFPGKGRGSIGHDPTEHFAMMGGISPAGRQAALESTTAGGNGRRYRGDRSLAEIAEGHGGQYVAFAAPGRHPALGSSAPEPNNPRVPTVDNNSPADYDRLKKEYIEATSGKYAAERFQAKQDFGQDKLVNLKQAQAVYRAALRQINADEADEQQKSREQLKAHHAEVLRQRQAHLKRLLALTAPSKAVIRAGAERDARAGDSRSQMQADVAAMTGDPETLALNQREQEARTKYDQRIKAAQGGLGPYTQQQQGDFALAKQELDLKLTGIQKERDAKKAADNERDNGEADAATKASLEATVQLQRELWQHAGGAMAAYFKSLRDEADAALKDVTDKYGPLGPGGKPNAHANAPAVAAATDEHTARIQDIKQQQTDAENQVADARQQHDLTQGKISLAQYIDYLTKRRDAFAQYSAEWLALDSQVYQADEDLQRKQLDAAEEMFRNKAISLEAYKKMLADLAAQVPAASPVHEEIVRAEDETRQASNQQTVGGQEFWDGLASSASEQGSKVLTALFHPREKKSIFKSLWADLMGSLEGGVTGQFSKMLKNLLTEDGGFGSKSFSIGGLFGGLFGKKKKTDAEGFRSEAGASPLAVGAGTSPGASSLFNVPGVSFLGGGSGKGLTGNLLGAMPLLSLFGNASPGLLHGINGPVGGAGNGLDLMSLAGLFPGGGILSKLLGGGGGIFGGLKKLFHFSAGGVVPGSGNHDTVPAMLTPGEIVIPKGLSSNLQLAAHFQQAAMPKARMPAISGTYGTSAPGVSPQGTTTGKAAPAGSVTAEFHDWGDKHYHYEADEDRSQRKMARRMEDALRGGVPA